MRLLHLFVLVCCSLLLTACQRHRVTVVDAANKPIAAAKVEPISLSMGHGVRLTDDNGLVTLPGKFDTIQEIVWVTVTKDGYQPSVQIPIDPSGKTTVVLKPAK